MRVVRSFSFNETVLRRSNHTLSNIHVYIYIYLLGLDSSVNLCCHCGICDMRHSSTVALFKDYAGLGNLLR